MPNDVTAPASKTPAGRAAATPAKEILKTTSMSADAVKVIPGHGIAGRHPKREHLDTLSGHKDPGMFGRMFPRLPPLEVSDAKLQALAAAMLDPDPTDTTRDNPHVPAGFTYLGQFIDHDITLDLTSLSEKDKDPLGIENFRTPSLDLDAVYGLGPDGSPHLYARNPENTSKHGPKLLIGKNINVDFGGVTGNFRNDLPRSPEGFALIGDHRNDENLLVAQTHLAFLKFHNKVCDLIAGSPTPPADIFAEARQTVTWHYQWMVLHDFVERLTEPGIVARILNDGRKFYRFKKTPYMPVEFSAAAYRLGHSMVRQTYSHNRVFHNPPADFSLIFGFSGLSGQSSVILLRTRPQAPCRFLCCPAIGSLTGAASTISAPQKAQPDFTLNHARKLDPFLIPELHTLPGGGAYLAFRNMKRGVNLGLPSGQDVAKAIRDQEPPHAPKRSRVVRRDRWPKSRASIKQPRFGTTS